MRRTAMALGVLGLAAVAAPAADAASISYDPGGKLVVTAASGETNDVVFYMVRCLIAQPATGEALAGR